VSDDHRNIAGEHKIFPVPHLLNIPFVGKLHPAIVHMPIGILLLALLLELISRREKYKDLKASIPIILLIGAFTAVLSCITGYILSLDGGYDTTTLDRHKWAGIATGIISIVAFALRTPRLASRLHAGYVRITGIMLAVLVVVTGHLGGTLTHGSAYLTESAPAFLKNISGGSSEAPLKKTPADVQEALAYEELVSPVLQEKCISCHGPEKQKGGLRLDGPEFLMKGGKNGKVLVMNDPSSSELYKRLLLPLQDEHHMPPKEKKQLTSQEIALLHWWIGNGMELSKKVKDIPQQDSIRKMLKAFGQPDKQAGSSEEFLLPEGDVPAADPAVLRGLEKMGLIVLPIDPARNYLQVNLINCDLPADNVIRSLAPLSQQIVWLKLSGKELTDTGMTHITALGRIRRLYLDNTKITDDGLMKLTALRDLRYLNLNGTHITTRGILSLKQLGKLRSVYLYNTGADRSEIAGILREFPSTMLDTGGYVLPFLASDTTEMKAVIKPK
jgi:uncharacterized membrane protein/mono/diheme cytochrome c family protein